MVALRAEELAEQPQRMHRSTEEGSQQFIRCSFDCWVGSTSAQASPQQARHGAKAPAVPAEEMEPGQPVLGQVPWHRKLL